MAYRLASAQTQERNHTIARLRQRGESYAQIGAAVGLSRTRVQQIVRTLDSQHRYLERFQRQVRANWPPDIPLPTDDLSARAWNCLVTIVLTPVDSGPTISRGILHQLLSKGPYSRHPWLRGCGMKTRQELLIWLAHR